MKFRRLLAVLILGVALSVTVASVASAATTTISPMCVPIDGLPCSTGY